MITDRKFMVTVGIVCAILFKKWIDENRKWDSIDKWSAAL